MPSKPHTAIQKIFCVVKPRTVIYIRRCSIQKKYHFYVLVGAKKASALVFSSILISVKFPRILQSGKNGALWWIILEGKQKPQSLVSVTKRYPVTNIHILIYIYCKFSLNSKKSLKFLKIHEHWNRYWRNKLS